MINTVGDLVITLNKYDKNKPIFDLYGEPNEDQERKEAKIFAVLERNGKVLISNAC
jgi:hypothetical protein